MVFNYGHMSKLFSGKFDQMWPKIILNIRKKLCIDINYQKTFLKKCTPFAIHAVKLSASLRKSYYYYYYYYRYQ